MSPLHLFDAAGIELEYMLVDSRTLDVVPRADDVLADLNGGVVSSDAEMGSCTWSNELALHVLELKTTDPTRDLEATRVEFQNAITTMHARLKPMGLRLMPTAMHPWMDPVKQTKLWPHENHEIYQTYDRIFDCRSQGWGNVQSVHLNLPFHGDDEFARLHAAVRLLLPILPALTASSPIVQGRLTGILDNRMAFYEHHCDAIPSMVGQVIPEDVYDEASYQQRIFDPIITDVEPHDPDQVMDPAFLNARGAIARFDRGSIEIRVMDVQEYPGADIAVCALVTAIAKMMVEEHWSSTTEQKRFATSQLKLILDATVKMADAATIEDRDYLHHFGMIETPIIGRDLWWRLIDQAIRLNTDLEIHAEPLRCIVEHGTLATRILQGITLQKTGDGLTEVYRRVSDCLIDGRSYVPS